MRHLGNELATDPDDEEKIDAEKGANVLSLADRFVGTRYLTPHSDLVALMVMEHQSQMHNFITLAHYETVLALDAKSKATEPTAAIDDETRQRIEKAGDSLVEYMLFCNEDQLTSPIAGTSTFIEDFTARGPIDSKGRSLRQFDLQTRMFRYPCSYLIHSPAFDALPQPVADYVRTRVLKVLKGEDQSPAFAHLSAEMRREILELLTETKPSWVGGGMSQSGG